eukprot:13417227-Alexandrium_andersonii.AAC.1
MCRQLERGRTCLLQETHWDESAAAIWKVNLPLTGLIASSSPAHLSTDGRRQSGTAALVPPPWSIDR